MTRQKHDQSDFSLDDFRKQFEQISRFGLASIIRRISGLEHMLPEGTDPENALSRMLGMIDSMTAPERSNAEIIDLSRRRRIAKGSGTCPHEVKLLVNQFKQIRDWMRQMAQMSIWQRIKMDLGFGKPRL